MSIINTALIGKLKKTKADKTNVLQLDNSTEYTPVGDYNPVTKKYVDSAVDGLAQSRRTQSFTATANQKIFVTTLPLSNFEVYLNGIKLATTDYSKVESTLTLVDGADVDDNLEVIDYGVIGESIRSSYVSSSTQPSSAKIGYIWYDELTNQVKVRTPAGWQTISDNTALNRAEFIATESQTTFNFAYTPGMLEIHLNGAKLSSSDYTATNGVSFTLFEGCAVDDVVDCLAFQNFSMSTTKPGEYIDAIIGAGGIKVTTEGATILDTVNANLYRAVEYIISHEYPSSYGVRKILLCHDGNSVHYTEYGVGNEDPYYEVSKINDTIELKVLANINTQVSFSKVMTLNRSTTAMSEFFQAYITGGVVTLSTLQHFNIMSTGI